jgi:hypothetical protein
MENVTSEKSKYGVQIIGLDENTYVYDVLVKNCRFNGVQSGNFRSGKTRNINFDNLFINGSLVLDRSPTSIIASGSPTQRCSACRRVICSTSRRSPNGAT